MKLDSCCEVYLDNNATTPVLEVAAQAAQDAMQKMYGNPSSNHITGLRARFILDSARDTAKRVLGAGQGSVIFLSGATEGIQTAIFSALNQVKQTAVEQGASVCKYLLYGATEHKAVPNSLNHWNKILGIGAEVKAIPVDENGLLDHSFIQQHLEQAAMICTMAVNNETGVIQDLKALESLIRGKNPTVAWMVDSVQALGKQPLDLSNTSIDYAPFSGHKLYAPKGIGMLYVRQGAALTPFIAGGGQEGGLRSGTENLPGVAAFGAVLSALDDPDSSVFKDHQTLVSYREQLVNTLKQAFPGIVFNMPFECSVPTTINFSVKDFPSKEILDLFDAAQIRVSSGSACSSGVTRSYVLDEMGLEPWRSESAIRMSFGPASTQAEIDMACQRILTAAQALRQSCLMLNALDADFSSPRQNGLIQLKKGAACVWIYADSASESCIIIDPVEELAERLEKFVECQGYQIKAILDTHSHADHESCRPMLLKVLESRLSYPAESYDNLGWPAGHTLQISLENGGSVEAITLGETTVLARLMTPGHTSDSQTFLLGEQCESQLLADKVKFAFVGDTVLIGGLGRTNFSSSSPENLYQSLHRIASVTGDKTLLCPAHDYNNEFATTVRAEVEHNALFKRVVDSTISESEFAAQKRHLDTVLKDQVGHEILCGVVRCSDVEDDGLHIQPRELKAYLSEHSKARIVDVREPHEYQLFSDWDALELKRMPENVPLSRFTHFLSEFLQQQDALEQELIFICRSGNRSAVAAESLRRIGLPHACHISGGVALNCG